MTIVDTLFHWINALKCNLIIHLSAGFYKSECVFFHHNILISPSYEPDG